MRKTLPLGPCCLHRKRLQGWGEVILQASPSLVLSSFDVLRCSQGLWGLFELSLEPPASPIGCHCYSCSCSLLCRERKPLKLLQLRCTVCWNSSHQKGEEEKCLYLFKLIIEAPAEMWRQTERGGLICGILLRKSIANLCIDFLLLAQNEAAVPKVLFTGNVLQWDRQTTCDQLSSCSAAREHHREVKSSAALIMGRFKPINNMKKSL